MEHKKTSTLSYTASQKQVLALDQSSHALLLGAAGSGKTTALLAAGAQHSKVLFLAPNRQAAAKLKEQYVAVAQTAVGGRVAQTMQAFALQLLTAAAVQRQEVLPRLLTAALQDEIISRYLLESDFEHFQNEHNRVYLRTEIRNLWQLCEELDLTVVAAQKLLLQQAAALAPQVQAAFVVLQKCEAELVDRAEYSAAGVLLAATKLLQRNPAGLELPELVLVDDAQELTYAEQQLLRALAAQGIAVWAAADPDSSTRVHIVQPETLPQLLQQLPPTVAMQQRGSAPQQVIFTEVVRAPQQLRQVTQRLREAIGVSAGVQHRHAASVKAAAVTPQPPVAAFSCASESELSSAIAYQLRQAKLGLLDGKPLQWQDMVVVCRSRDTVTQLCRELSHRGVPAKTSGGGIVLREHAVVRNLIGLLQVLLTAQPVSDALVEQILLGPLGGFTIAEVAQLKQQLLLVAREKLDPSTATAQGLLAALCDGEITLPGSAAALRVTQLGQVLQHAAKQRNRSDLQELLWLLWDGLADASALQETALSGKSDAARDANELLDTVMELFYVVERNETQQLGANPLQFLTELLNSEVPQDTLARQAQQDAVIVTTPHMLVGQEYAMVCVAQLQEGAWPNLRSRDAYLQLASLEALLRQREVNISDRYELLHAETRLLLLACSRATAMLRLFVVNNDETYPSPLWRFFQENQEPTIGVPPQLTLRGEVARLRAALETNPADDVSAAQLAQLAAAAITGADPQQWYGIKTPTGQPQLRAPHQQTTITPSQLVSLHQCETGAVLNLLNGATSPNHRAAMGTLLHAGLEQASEATDYSTAKLLQPARENWDKLSFKTPALSEIAKQQLTVVATNLGRYAQTQQHDWEVIGSEIPFTATIGEIRLRGVIDRIEQKINADGTAQLRIVDLKTSKTVLSQAETQASLQLAAYQYGVQRGELAAAQQPQLPTQLTAALIYPKHEAVTGSRAKTFTERTQSALDEAALDSFASTVTAAVATLQGATFEFAPAAQCPNPHCVLHQTPAVSWQE